MSCVSVVDVYKNMVGLSWPTLSDFVNLLRHNTSKKLLTPALGTVEP